MTTTSPNHQAHHLITSSHQDSPGIHLTLQHHLPEFRPLQTPPNRSDATDQTGSRLVFAAGGGLDFPETQFPWDLSGRGILPGRRVPGARDAPGTRSRGQRRRESGGVLDQKNAQKPFWSSMGLSEMVIGSAAIREVILGNCAIPKPTPRRSVSRLRLGGHRILCVQKRNPFCLGEIYFLFSICMP